MGEEINRRETERNDASPRLSDAELSGVSGGAGDISLVHYSNQQQKVCHECPLFRDRQCKKDLDLRTYLQRNGVDSVKTHTQCPFYEG